MIPSSTSLCRGRADWVYLFATRCNGISRVASAIRDRTEHQWLMVVSGVISIIFGVVLVFLPDTSLHALVWVIGIYAIAIGVALVVYSYRFRVRELGRNKSSR